MNPLKNIRNAYVIALWTNVFIVPMIFHYLNNGPVLRGDLYAADSARIRNIEQLLSFIDVHSVDYLQIYRNPLFIFFIAAFAVQKIAIWIKSGN